MVVLKSETEIAAMRRAGRVVADTLAAVAAAARPGVRLTDLDGLAAELMAGAGAKPSFLGYHPSWAPTPYPAVLCLSVNEAVVHGIPDGRPLPHPARRLDRHHRGRQPRGTRRTHRGRHRRRSRHPDHRRIAPLDSA